MRIYIVTILVNVPLKVPFLCSYAYEPMVTFIII